MMHAGVNMCIVADWPDYEAESDSETGSETEVIVAGGSSGPSNQSDLGGLVVQPSNPSSAVSSHWELESSALLPQSSSPYNIPSAAADSQTAQKIMHLLDEIGTSNLVDRPPHDSTRFLHCVHCSGRLVIL